jgi:CRISPR system Cascade subunit CasE
MELIMARARLRRDVPAVAIARLLVPSDSDQRVGASHNLLWLLYRDGPDRTRDYLWRQTRPGQFLTLGARAPVDEHRLFDLECKQFAPELKPGQRLNFNLRANATVSRAAARSDRGVRCDIVMAALQDLPRGSRAAARHEVMQGAATTWLARQGEEHGFALCGNAVVESYKQVAPPRERGQRPAKFNTLDLTGTLEVVDPQRFLAQIAKGFGRARAFGCGLMLIRPVYAW